MKLQQSIKKLGDSIVALKASISSCKAKKIEQDSSFSEKIYAHYRSDLLKKSKIKEKFLAKLLALFKFNFAYLNLELVASDELFAKYIFDSEFNEITLNHAILKKYKEQDQFAYALYAESIENDKLALEKSLNLLGDFKPLPFQSELIEKSRLLVELINQILQIVVNNNLYKEHKNLLQIDRLEKELTETKAALQAKIKTLSNQYNTVVGQYNSAQKSISHLQSKICNLQGQLSYMQAQVWIKPAVSNFASRR